MSQRGRKASGSVTVPDPALYGDDETRQRLIHQTTTWFVVGLGNSPERAAFRVARFLQAHGKRIVPIHPRAEVVHGEPGYRTIAQAVESVGPPDVVDVFVQSSRAGEFADDAVAADAKGVWFQLGVVDENAARRVIEAGAAMVMDACPVIEWR